MSEHDNLQDADGDNLNETPQENNTTKQAISSEETSLEEVAASKTPTEESSISPEKEGGEEREGLGLQGVEPHRQR
jgi:hypothetical protein